MKRNFFLVSLFFSLFVRESLASDIFSDIFSRECVHYFESCEDRTVEANIKLYALSGQRHRIVGLLEHCENRGEAETPICGERLCCADFITHRACTLDLQWDKCVTHFHRENILPAVYSRLGIEGDQYTAVSFLGLTVFGFGSIYYLYRKCFPRAMAAEAKDM